MAKAQALATIIPPVKQSPAQARQERKHKAAIRRAQGGPPYKFPAVKESTRK